MRRLLLILARAFIGGVLVLASAAPLAAQQAVLDSTCYLPLRAAVDSLGKLHLPSTTTTTYQRRAVQTLTSAHTLYCSRVVTPPPPPPPPVDTTPVPPPPTPGVAALPRAVPIVPAGLDTRACTQTVTANLQAALTAAKGGDVLCLAGTFRGNFVVPARADTAWVVVRSAGTLPPGRITPSAAGPLAKLVSGNASSALRFAPRAARVAVLGMEITADSSLSAVASPVALVEIGTGQEATVADLPTDIALDRVYVHGASTQHIRRAIATNGGAMTVRRSWCEEIHATGFDSQCVIAWNATGPLLIEDNYLSAASENLMFGGADPRIPGLVVEDVTIRRNHLAKPATWLGRGWNVKNLIETKASRRVLVEANVLEGQWFDAAPGHAAMTLKSTSQNGGCPRCDSSDWTVRRNLFQRVGTWLSIAGRADQGLTNNGGGSVAGRTDSTNRRMAFLENYVDSLSVAPYTNQNRPAILFVAENYDITLARNTIGVVGATLEAGIVWDVSGASKTSVVNLTLADNVLTRGRYGIFASATAEGAPSFTKGALGASTWTNNAIVGGRVGTYPPGTTWHPSLASALGVAGVSRALVDAAVAGVVVPR